MRKLFKYENAILIPLFLTFGLVFMDKLSFTFLMPFIADDMGFNNTQSGTIIGIVAAFFGISTLIFASISDALGSNKKRMLVIFVVLFSLATLAVVWAKNYSSMLAIRAIMGVTEGPVIPLVLAIVLGLSSDDRKGLNIGITQGAGPLMSSVFAPAILIPIAVSYHWKIGFYSLAIPGFILAAVLWFFLKDTKVEETKKASLSDFLGLLKNRNILICMIMGIFYMISLMSFVAFAPLYWANFRELPQSSISILLVAFGIGTFIWFFTIPAISDRYGRKPVLILVSLLSISLPLFMAFTNFGLVGTCVGLLLLTFSVGHMPLIATLIPSESVPKRFVATSLAAMIITSEMIGGTVGPIICGVMADKYDLRAPFIVGAIAAVITFLLALGIKETREIAK